MMTLDLYQMDFSLKRLHDLKGKNIRARVCQKSLPNLVGVSVDLGQSTNGRAPFWGSQWLARIRHCVPAPMEKGHFSGIICRRCLQGTWSTYSGEHNASVFRLCHCSQVPKCILQCTKTGVTRMVTNGDKLLCNNDNQLHTYSNPLAYACLDLSSIL